MRQPAMCSQYALRLARAAAREEDVGAAVVFGREKHLLDGRRPCQQLLQGLARGPVGREERVRSSGGLLAISDTDQEPGATDTLDQSLARLWQGLVYRDQNTAGRDDGQNGRDHSEAVDPAHGHHIAGPQTGGPKLSAQKARDTRKVIIGIDMGIADDRCLFTMLPCDFEERPGGGFLGTSGDRFRKIGDQARRRLADQRDLVALSVRAFRQSVQNQTDLFQEVARGNWRDGAGIEAERKLQPLGALPPGKPGASIIWRGAECAHALVQDQIEDGAMARFSLDLHVAKRLSQRCARVEVHGEAAVQRCLGARTKLQAGLAGNAGKHEKRGKGDRMRAIPAPEVNGPAIDRVGKPTAASPK